MALLLSIETSTSVCSVALHQDAHLLAHTELHAEKAHARFLTHLIGECCANSGISLSMIDAVAVSKGPGSYTGLRIGVSSAKGLCFALEKPLIAIDTLEAMAYGARQHQWKSCLLAPMIDARRMEVYTSVFDFSLACLKPTHACVVDDKTFSELDGDVLLFGNGAAKCKEVFSDRKNIFFLDSVVPSAKWIGALAAEKCKEQIFEDVAYFEPFYLKDFVRFGK
ncbi:MAG: tRNA (adenosine(37)-N6)-threonylcarbamoyltransferase complex dimerization subunit type 1 TsaB [Cytophagaceae bacterium]|jgi:tRNA threonylcarbamoyladenosine biosynthesis protein TsaB|nr:tRNA (adenosine(37)-N6)-threonylcarbamoyltransferase complex dimerization subunit type 1 TsaB [Cytophagaceae bacterium]